jgi:hypothetical protein
MLHEDMTKEEQTACKSDEELLRMWLSLEHVMGRHDLSNRMKKLLVIHLIIIMFQKHKGCELRKGKDCFQVGTGMYRTVVTVDTICQFFNPVIRDLFNADVKKSTLFNTKSHLNRFLTIWTYFRANNINAHPVRKILDILFGSHKPPEGESNRAYEAYRGLEDTYQAIYQLKYARIYDYVIAYYRQ